MPLRPPRSPRAALHAPRAEGAAQRAQPPPAERPDGARPAHPRRIAAPQRRRAAAVARLLLLRPAAAARLPSTRRLPLAPRRPPHPPPHHLQRARRVRLPAPLPQSAAVLRRSPQQRRLGTGPPEAPPAARSAAAQPGRTGSPGARQLQHHTARQQLAGPAPAPLQPAGAARAAQRVRGPDLCRRTRQAARLRTAARAAPRLPPPTRRRPRRQAAQPGRQRAAAARHVSQPHPPAQPAQWRAALR